MKLLPTCFLAGSSVALVFSPLPSSPLLSSTDSKIGSNSSMSPARSHERSVCAIPIDYHPPCGREKPLTFGGHRLHFSTLVFLREPSPKFGPNYGRLQGAPA